jgi:hypothetical protein
MMRGSSVVPTLTEVIELAAEPLPLDAQVPMGPEALAIEDLGAAEVLALLQPRVEALVDLRLRAALGALLPGWADAVAQAVRRDLKTALPELVAQALAESRSRRR